jgi:hypothetical protein
MNAAEKTWCHNEDSTTNHSSLIWDLGYRKISRVNSREVEKKRFSRK